jgi:hypothetical protein
MHKSKFSSTTLRVTLIHRTRIGITVILSTIALSACNGDSNSTNNTNGTNVGTKQPNKNLSNSIKTSNLKKNSLKSDQYLLRMGGGYDKVSQTATSGQSCLANASDPTNIYITNPSAMITFEEESNMSALQNALDVNVSGSYGGDRFGVSVAANFANLAKDDAYTTNIVYLYKFAGKAVFRRGSLGQGLAALTPYAASLEQTSPTKFRAMCGNSFVEQMDAGATLSVVLSLNFNSHIDQENFNANMEGHYGLADVAAKIEQAASHANTHISLTLNSFQQGGEPQKLNDLFGTDSSGSYPMLQCQDGPTGSDACTKMIANIITYAQTLKDQLAGSSGGLNLDKLYYTNPTPTDYANLGIPTQEAADPSYEILKTMEELTTEYDKAMKDLQFTTHYLTALPNSKLDNSIRVNLQNAANRLHSQVYNVFKLPAYNLMDCYKGYVSTSCLKIRENVEVALERYKLKDHEANLINYLESNSYSGYLMNYNGGANPTPVDYHLSKSACIFAPVSTPNAGYYAINCNGRWLDTNSTNKFTILSGIGESGIVVKNLSYMSVPSTSPLDKSTNGKWVTYRDEFLPVDPYLPNYFYHDNMIITAPEFSTSNARIGLTLSEDSKA